GGASDVVTIRGLTLNSLATPGSGSIGIDYSSGGTLYVQNTVVKGFDQGLYGSANASATIAVEDSLFTRNITGALFFEGDPGGHLHATIDRSRFEDGLEGVDVFDRATAVIRDSVLAGLGNV